MAPDEHEQPDADQPANDDVDGLLDIIERAISTGRPIDVIGLASAAIAIVLFPEKEEDPERFVLREKVLEQVVLRYVEVGSTEALIYANALTLLLPNDTLRTSLAPALDGSEPALPEWLARAEAAVLEQPTIVRDLFDDDEWLLAGVRFADGSRFSFRVEINHDTDSAATDAILMPNDVDDVRQRLRASGSEEELAIIDTDATDFWARYTEAVALADELDTPGRSDTWPSCRPAIEWALRQAPAAG